MKSYIEKHRRELGWRQWTDSEIGFKSGMQLKVPLDILSCIVDEIRFSEAIHVLTPPLTALTHHPPTHFRSHTHSSQKTQYHLLRNWLASTAHQLNNQMVNTALTGHPHGRVWRLLSLLFCACGHFAPESYSGRALKNDVNSQSKPWMSMEH